MDVTVDDIVKLDGKLTAWCSSCRKMQVLCGPGCVVRIVPTTFLSEVQPRLRCGQCGRPGELWISFATKKLLNSKSLDSSNYNRTPYDPDYGS